MMMRWGEAIIAACFCVLIWFLMDRYVFGELNNAHYYIAVGCAFLAGRTFTSPERNDG